MSVSVSPQFARAVLDRNMTVETAPFRKALDNADLAGVTILDFGCGNGNLLRLLKNSKAEMIYAFEVVPDCIDDDILEWAQDPDARPRLVINPPEFRMDNGAPVGDLTGYNYEQLLASHDKFAILSNPPYFLFNRILSLTTDTGLAAKFAGALMITSKGRLFNHAGWTIREVMDAKYFNPPAGNTQYLVQTGLGLRDDENARPCGTPQIFPHINNRDALADPSDHYPEMWQQLEQLKP